MTSSDKSLVILILGLFSPVCACGVFVSVSLGIFVLGDSVIPCIVSASLLLIFVLFEISVVLVSEGSSSAFGVIFSCPLMSGVSTLCPKGLTLDVSIVESAALLFEVPRNTSCSGLFIFTEGTLLSFEGDTGVFFLILPVCVFGSTSGVFLNIFCPSFCPFYLQDA